MITEIASVYPHHDFIWIFKPLIRVLQVLGIDLDVSAPPSALRRFCFLLSAVAILILMGCEGAIECFRHSSAFLVGSKCDARHAVVSASKAISHGVLTICLAVATMSCTFKWTTLWETARQLEHVLPFSSHFYVQLRKTCIAFIITGTLLVTMGVIQLDFFNSKLNYSKI